MLVRTLRRPRWAMPITTSRTPQALAPSINVSNAGTTLSEPSSEKRLVPGYLMSRKRSKPSASLSWRRRHISAGRNRRQKNRKKRGPVRGGCCRHRAPADRDWPTNDHARDRRGSASGRGWNRPWRRAHPRQARPARCALRAPVPCGHSIWLAPSHLFWRRPCR